MKLYRIYHFRSFIWTTISCAFHFLLRIQVFQQNSKGKNSGHVIKSALSSLIYHTTNNENFKLEQSERACITAYSHWFNSRSTMTEHTDKSCKRKLQLQAARSLEQCCQHTFAIVYTCTH